MSKVAVRSMIGSVTGDKIMGDWEESRPTYDELLRWTQEARAALLELEQLRGENQDLKRQLANLKYRAKKQQIAEADREALEERRRLLSNEHVTVAQKLAAAQALTGNIEVTRVKVLKAPKKK